MLPVHDGPKFRPIVHKLIHEKRKGERKIKLGL